MADISVVICTRRRPANLARCLATVARLNPAPTQVIVVDNSDGDPATQEVAKEFGVKYVVEPKAGLDPARKRGLAECSSKDVVFLEDDALPESNWLKTLEGSVSGNKVQPLDNVLSIDSSGSRIRRTRIHRN